MPYAGFRPGFFGPLLWDGDHAIAFLWDRAHPALQEETALLMKHFFHNFDLVISCRVCRVGAMNNIVAFDHAHSINDAILARNMTDFYIKFHNMVTAKLHPRFKPKPLAYYRALVQRRFPDTAARLAAIARCMTIILLHLDIAIEVSPQKARRIRLEAATAIVLCDALVRGATALDRNQVARELDSRSAMVLLAQTLAASRVGAREAQRESEVVAARAVQELQAGAERPGRRESLAHYEAMLEFVRAQRPAGPLGGTMSAGFSTRHMRRV